MPRTRDGFHDDVRRGVLDRIQGAPFALRPDDTSPKRHRSSGKTFAARAAFYNASFSRNVRGGGLATQGTRLLAHFEGVPAGVSLFVTERPTAASSTASRTARQHGPGRRWTVRPRAPIVRTGSRPSRCTTALRSRSGRCSQQALRPRERRVRSGRVIHARLIQTPVRRPARRR